MLPKSMASPSLLSYLITSKFVDGLPLYWVSRQLEPQYGIESPYRRHVGQCDSLG
jgi:hypothetical protein